MVALVSHGDTAKQSMKNKNDPQLTHKGKIQARVTGDFLDAYAQANDKLNFDKVIVECSPFLRTMMAGCQIVAAFRQRIAYVNYLASEILTRGQIYTKQGQQHIFGRYSENPMEKLEFKKYNYDFKEMQKQDPYYKNSEFFPIRISVKESKNQKSFKDKMMKQFPETPDQGLQRYLDLLDYIKNLILK